MKAIENRGRLTEVRRSPIHGKGLFALRAFTARARILEYVGNKISKRESLRLCERGNTCIFALDEASDLDGNVQYNRARFLNHSCTPNCEAALTAGRIWLVARRDISAGEELTFNYGYDLVDYREYPCHCGSLRCVGYIVAEEFFNHVRQQDTLKTL